MHTENLHILHYCVTRAPTAHQSEVESERSCSRTRGTKKLSGRYTGKFVSVYSVVSREAEADNKNVDHMKGTKASEELVALFLVSSWSPANRWSCAACVHAPLCARSHRETGGSPNKGNVTLTK